VPTTPHFKEVFLGKCFDKNPAGTDCYSLYGNFSAAGQMDNSNVTDASYDAFFAIANFSTPKSSILFWSGNMAFALAISSNDPRFVTVEETSTGYILNGLSWCGTPDNNGWNYDSPCYYPSNSTYYGTQGVWTRASQMFAHGAHGSVYVLLQPASIGGNPPVYQAFRNTSIFSQTELPNMSTDNVTDITILLLKNHTSAPDEVCGKGSVLVLESRIKQKFNFMPKCIDDPQKIYSLLCPRSTQVSAQCLAATLVYTYETQNNDKRLIWPIVMSAVAGVLFIIVLILLSRLLSHKRKGSLV
jgi:ADP-ribosyl cyclase 1